MRLLTVLTLTVLLVSCSKTEQSDSPAYKNASLSPEERAKDLLGRMTVQEKIAQMYCVWNTKYELILDTSGGFDVEKARKNFKDGLGQVGRPSDTKGGLDPYQNAVLTN